MSYSKDPEETLDPENWDEFRVLGHKMLDDMVDHIKNIREQPFRRATKEESSRIRVPLTKEGEGEEETYRAFVRDVLPSMTQQKSPKFWALVVGGGTPYGMLADLLQSGTNVGSDDPDSAAYDVNQQALEWMKELLDYPRDASGTFVSGGSEASFTGLAVARNAKAQVDMKKEGMQGVPRKMTLYVSDEGHHCLERSVELLGLGGDALRWVKTDDECRIDIASLKREIEKDRSKGSHPFCVIGCAGTVNSGAFDDFNTLADLAEKEKMWLHVDGAFGAWVKISETHRHLAEGMERADSLAVDLHKWMYMPYGIGCTLVRHPREHLSTFIYGHEAEYLKTMQGYYPDGMQTYNLGLRLSNEFLSLRVYMLLRAYGKEKYRRLIQQNLDQIGYLASQIGRAPDMEVTAPVTSNVVCFRYNPGGLGEEQLQKLNQSILYELWRQHLGCVSDTTIKGRYMLRACNVNHRSRREDFDWLVAEVKKLGQQYIPSIKRG